MSDAVFLLQHVATGMCMPQVGRGASYWEPLLDDHSKLKPRIFWSKRAAQNARSAWVRGPWKQDSGTSGWETPEYWEEVVPVVPQRPRAVNDLALIELRLEEIEHA